MHTVGGCGHNQNIGIQKYEIKEETDAHIPKEEEASKQSPYLQTEQKLITIT